MIHKNVVVYNFTGRPISEDLKLDISDPVIFLQEKFLPGMIFGQDSLLRTGRYKEMGWCYDFRPFLKLYLVKIDYAWSEYYCLNKTTLRKLLYGNVQRIIEIPQEAA
jgi:hypothetical protein